MTEDLHAEQLSLEELGKTLIVLDRQGYKPVRGYSFAARTDTCGPGTIEVHAIAMPPIRRIPAQITPIRVRRQEVLAWVVGLAVATALAIWTVFQRFY